MAYTPTPLQPGVVLGITMAVVYTSTGNTLIKSGVAANIASGATFSVQVTRASGGGALVVIPPRSIAAAATDLMNEISGFVLRAGDTISASAGAAASINLFLNGLVF